MNLDINEMKKLIDEKKRQSPVSNIGIDGRPKKFAIIEDLRKSLITGQPTETSEKIKVIDKVAASIREDKDRGGNGKFDPSLISEIERLKKERQSGQFTKQNNNQFQQRNPSNENQYNDNDALYEAELRKLQSSYNKNQHHVPQYNDPYFQQNNIREEYSRSNNLVLERVDNLFNSFITENLSGLLNEALKNTINDIYANERVERVLTENRDKIKKIVVECIIELQERKKKQQ